MTDIEDFTNAYIEALYFTETGDDGISETGELSFDLLAEIQADCTKFWDEFGETVNAAECDRGGQGHSKAAQAGHDFWLTRNGHGVGFWDGDWSEPHATKLDEGATAFGETWVYQGNDLFIHGN